MINGAKKVKKIIQHVNTVAVILQLADKRQCCSDGNKIFAFVSLINGRGSEFLRVANSCKN